MIKKLIKKPAMRLLLLLVCCFQIGSSWAEGHPTDLREDDIAHEPANLQNGIQVAMNLCTLCHDLKYVKYHDLLEIGLSAKEVDKIRGANSASDPILSKMNDKQMNALFGMTTPDLSLMAKARGDGAQYIYSLLLAYHERRDGAIVNNLYPDIKMPDVLAYSIENDERARSAIEQNARDIAAFLAWTADPKAKERRTLGVYVMLYLFVLTFMLYRLKQKTWSRLKT
ncbi:MAG: cytochrome C [Gammaproteobacteria bacterium]|nr:cytochrome C [Gammaproteobacteria bacterium]